MLGNVSALAGCSSRHTPASRARWAPAELSARALCDLQRHRPHEGVVYLPLCRKRRLLMCHFNPTDQAKNLIPPGHGEAKPPEEGGEMISCSCLWLPRFVGAGVAPPASLSSGGSQMLEVFSRLCF